MNEEGRPARRPPTSASDSDAFDLSIANGAQRSVAPALIVAFELERKPRALNAAALTEDQLIRIVDWIVERPGAGALDLRTWLERIRCEREEMRAA